MAISISFDRKDKNLTHWITLTYINTDPSPQTIIDALREAGWETARDRGLSDIPEIDGELTVSLSRRGSGLFTSWLPDEKKQFLSASVSPGYPSMNGVGKIFNEVKFMIITNRSFALGNF
jgi:hypothetical protein